MRASAAAAGGPAAVGLHHDARETSAPLLLLGAILSVAALIQLVGPDSLFGGVGDLLTATCLTLGFAVLWVAFRTRAARQGRVAARGFGTAATVGLAVNLVGSVAVIYAGPYLVFGVGLLIAAWRLPNRYLAGCALGVGALGVFEGFFGFTNRLPFSLWASWEHTAIYLVLGAATIGAGVAARIREDRAG
ncbi:MAG TPA: hypothetical protein VGI64_11420 [Streptosporangiaceae bacterium]